MNERVFVISGATGGLGRVVAGKFGALGYSLALLGTSEPRLRGLIAELRLPAERVLAHRADLRQEAEVKAAAAAVASRFGHVHGLIHLVGGWSGGHSLAETDPRALEDMLAQHVRTTFLMLASLVPLFQKAGWGRVIAVSSPSATEPPGQNGAYAAAKAAQESLILTLAAELAGTPVTANVIQVRSIDAERTGKGTPPEEVAAAMAYLCTDEGRAVNGARIRLSSR